jgi:hypothetical protein
LNFSNQKCNFIFLKITTIKFIRFEVVIKKKMSFDKENWVKSRYGIEDNPTINTKTIKALCKKNNLFQTLFGDNFNYIFFRHLNDKIYLHFQGFRKIENLDGLSEIRALWLQGNAISKIENLETCPKIRCLYLQDNCIEVW